MGKMKKEELLEKLTEKQKGYDYSLLPNEFTYKTKLPIICHKKDILGNEHGVFHATCGKLLRGDACPKCRGRHMTKEAFVAESRLIHGDKYVYDDFVFVDKRTKGKIFCPKHNLYFEQTPTKHLSGHGCPKCRYEKSSASKTHTQEWFLEKAKNKHGDKYDYGKTVYKKSDEKVCIICHKKDKYGVEHGEFWMAPDNHLHKTSPQGCPKCARENTINATLVPFEEFAKNANIVHGGKYSYNKETFINMQEKTEITCPIHGPFWQKPSNHTSLRQGCPMCSNQMSKSEEEIINFINNEGKGLTVERRNRNIIKPFEVDIYIPEKKIAIEFDGLVWHSEKFGTDKNAHLDKTAKCLEKGIRLIHIFEDEWMFKQKITESRLRSILGLTERKIFARKCEIREVGSTEAMQFLDNNHLQGRCKAKFHYGLYLEGELVSLMTFGVTRQQRKYNEDYDAVFELLRFCNKLDTNVVGGASKLLNHFIKEASPKKVISYADKRWSDGNLYKQLGFEHTHDSAPNYFYVVGKHRENRFKYRKSELVRQGFDEGKSEHEIMLDRGLYRIYDCGCMVFSKTF